jgi:sulfatase maturation enzyme AslB (radical SAM superfamily)
LEANFNKDTFCVAPWIGMHLSTFENVIPCCLYKQERVFGKLKKGEPLTAHHNSEVAKDIRKRLWDGEKIKECQECWFREEVSTTVDNPNSYRWQLNNRFKGRLEEILNNTNEDFSLKEVKLNLIDLRFDNKCNLKCRICSPTFSSALYKEYKDLGFTNFIDHGSPYNISVSDKEYEEILPQLHNADVIFFAGGEPLTQDRYYEILQYCVDNDLAKNITLWVTSNFTKLHYKNFDNIKLWKEFKEVEITASIDGIEQRGEYLRKGCTWSEVIKNIEYLRAAKLQQVRFMIVPTVNLMNSYNVIDLYKTFMKKGYIKVSDCHFNLLTHPVHMQFKNLPSKHKESLRELYLGTIDWVYKLKYEKQILDIEADKFHFLISLLDQEANEEELELFVKRTLQVDKYRGDDFFNIFPEFQDLLSDYLTKYNLQP